MFLPHVHDSGGRSPGRFADQQMDVLRHHDMTLQGKLKTFPDFAKNLGEEISGVCGAKERQSAIAT